jgi:hypothetical protein
MGCNTVFWWTFTDTSGEHAVPILSVNFFYPEGDENTFFSQINIYQTTCHIPENINWQSYCENLNAQKSLFAL